MKTSFVFSKSISNDLTRASFITFLAVLSVLTPIDSRAQSGLPLWTNYYGGAPGSSAGARAMTTDASGNVYVTGASESGSVFSCVTIAYANTGGALWTNVYSNGDDDRGVAIATDGTNVYVAGYTTGSNIDALTLAYSSAGIPLWTNRYSGLANLDDKALDLTVSPAGDVYVTGQTVTGPNTAAYLTLAYSSSGTPLWTESYAGAGTGPNTATAIVAAPNGNLYVTGTDFDSGGSRFGTVAYSSTGAFLWARTFRETNSFFVFPRDVTFDGDNVYVSGRSDTFTGASYLVLAYSSAGVPLWTNFHRGNSAFANDCFAAAAKDGRICVTGYSFDIHSASQDYTTLAYTSNGVPLWTNLYNGPISSTDRAKAIAIDAAGNVYVTGESQGTNLDLATVAYTSAGVPLWTNRFDGPGHIHDRGYAIALDSEGNVYVTGETQNSAIDLDFVTIKYERYTAAPELLPIPLNLLRLPGNQVELSWTNPAFRLQSAPAVEGIYTNIPAATSPHTNAISGAQQFFRLMGN